MFITGVIIGFINDARYGGLFLLLACFISAIAVFLFAIRFLDGVYKENHRMDWEKEPEGKAEEDEKKDEDDTE